MSRATFQRSFPGSRNLIIMALPLALAGCMTNPVQPTRPVLSCQDCQGLTYYGPQQAPAEAPGVSMARVLVGGAVKIAGYGFAADAAQGIANTVASAGKVQVVNQPAPTVVQQPAPVVLEQPEPIIVQPQVVNPQIVSPEIISPEIVRPEIVSQP